MADSPYFGMQGTGRWDGDERPQSWRQQLLKNYPRGSMPITAIMSKAGKTVIGDPVFHWWEKDLIQNAGVIAVAEDGDETAIYIDQAMTDIYEDGWAGWNAPVGTTLHIKIDATADNPLTNYVRVGSDIVLVNTLHYGCCTRAVVTNVDRAAGANSRITIKLLTADTAVDLTSLAHANRVIVMPTTFPEFGGVPQPQGFKPHSYENYTTIKKTSIAESRTAMSVKNLRPDSNDYKEAKREALEILGMQMEWETFFGILDESTDPDNNQPIRRSMGIRQFIENHGLSTNIASYKYAADYSGKTWLQGGYQWLMDMMLTFSTYSDLENMLHVVGNGVKMALTNLAESRRTITMTQMDIAFGLSISKFITPWGTFNIVDAPLWNREPTMQYTWLGIPRDAMDYHTLTEPETGNSDIQFLPDPNYGKGGMGHVDGRFDLWLVEFGYEFHKSKEWFLLYDVGVDNAV